MAYSAVPDHRMGYDNDGTVVYASAFVTGNNFLAGPSAVQSQATLQSWQALTASVFYSSDQYKKVYWFFPEQREVTAMYNGWAPNVATQQYQLQGSSDTTNGSDGTWETASWPGGAPTSDLGFDAWRRTIRAVSFTGGKRTLRMYFGHNNPGGNPGGNWNGVHVYGEKVAGQTPNDIIYINHDDTPGTEYTSVEDFGDRPLGTSVVRQFRVKNTSATLTANGINIQLNDPNNVMSTDNTNWVVTINITSLAPGAESSTMYIRNTTPGAGNALGPRAARIVTIVTSWT